MLLIAGAIAVPLAANPNTTPELKPWIGEPNPAFTLDDLTGQRRSLEEFKGKIVLVHFFATWCAPCVDEITSLQKLVRQARGKPLAVVAVDVAEVELRVRAFFEKLPVDFPVLLDRDRTITKAWEVVGLPTTFVLDASLTPKLFVEGDLDWSHPDIVKKLEALYPVAAEAGPRTGG
ncbi:MAG: TlpA family protein disulfide reductase [Bradyrhizobiaceae bacterium]|nr:TlpA family protein disulfide reductase [Bradyrhizobiaceae bacterium]